MDRRYQVFVSSTYEDLHEERREVMQALLALDCIPTGMELFPAADEDSWTHIKRFIQACDYYIVIVGGRYGSAGPDGKSFTEMEYDYAVEAGLPTLAFLHRDPAIIPAGKTEPGEAGKAALAAFRKKIEQARHAKYWTSGEGLAGAVALSMSSLMKIKPQVGWVRANLVPDESAAQESLKLRRRIEELESTLAGIEVTPPMGSEVLAQGEEVIALRFRFQISLQNEYVDATEPFSWNDILSFLGPILIDQASEQQLKDKMEEVFGNRHRDKKHIMIYNIYMRDEDFQRVKLQLRALGIIELLREAGKVQGGWTLTPYGDRLLNQVGAIRSSNAEAAKSK